MNSAVTYSQIILNLRIFLRSNLILWMCQLYIIIKAIGCNLSIVSIIQIMDLSIVHYNISYYLR